MSIYVLINISTLLVQHEYICAYFSIGNVDFIPMTDMATVTSFKAY